MTQPHYTDASVTLHHGDCLDVLRSLPDASVDSVVTDPPYGLEFMGKEWDGANGFRRSLNPADAGRDNAFGRTSRTSPEYRAGSLFQQWCELWTSECLRVLKPGGHLLAFGGTRTWHRLACAVEDAGFEVRDSIAWLYGSGFPKSLDVSKAIDKAAGAEREVLRPRLYEMTDGGGYSGNLNTSKPRSESAEITAPATDDARTWQGWGTALKPAFEPVVVARKPLVGTVAANVLLHGTGALNVDGCRVAGDVPATTGRWPANVVLDESQAEALDAQSGVGQSRIGKPRGAASGDGWGMTATGAEYNDKGGASRFFYVAKAPKSERPTYDKAGETTMFAGSVRKRCTICGKQEVNMPGSMCVCPEPDFQPDPSMQGKVSHPTVKPLALMRWLVRLVTPPGGTVLEPFAGSGTTVEACILEGFHCLAIEREADYLPLIEARIQRGQATAAPDPHQLDLFGGEIA